MFLYVLETKVSHHVSENTLLVRSGEEERNTKQKQKKQKGERGRFVQDPPARGQFTGGGGMPLCARATSSLRALGRNANPPSSFDSNI